MKWTMDRDEWMDGFWLKSNKRELKGIQILFLEVN